MACPGNNVLAMSCGRFRTTRRATTSSKIGGKERAPVLVQQHGVVSGAVCALKPGMAVEEEGELGRVDNPAVDHSARLDVARPVRVPGIEREEAGVVALLNHHKRQLQAHTTPLISP